MNLSLRPITEDEARGIARWRYPEPYGIYDGDPASVPSLLDPRNRYHAALDDHGDLVGFFCFGADATVPEGRRLGLYEDADLDIGLGLRPDLTGRGLGARFVETGVRFAEERYRPSALRLTVAAANRRAIKVYAAAGFAEVARFGESGSGWLIMRRGGRAQAPKR